MTEQEAAAASKWIEEMEPGLPVCCVADDMLDLTVEDALFHKREEVRARARACLANHS